MVVSDSTASNHDVLLLAGVMMMIPLIISVFIILITLIPSQHVIIVHATDVHFCLSAGCSRREGTLIAPTADELVVIVLSTVSKLVDHLTMVMHHQIRVIVVIMMGFLKFTMVLGL